MRRGWRRRADMGRGETGLRALLPSVLPPFPQLSRRWNRFARFMAVWPRRVEPFQQAIETMLDKGWTPRKKTTRVAARPWAWHAAGWTPQERESGERFHPLRCLHQGGVDHQQSPFAAGSASLELQDADRGALGRNRWARQRFAETLHGRDKAVVGSVGSANSAQTGANLVRLGNEVHPALMFTGRSQAANACPTRSPSRRSCAILHA